MTATRLAAAIRHAEGQVDAGVNTVKVFVLIYKLDPPSDIFQRYPGVEGGLYLVGGDGTNYLSSGETALPPIRLGAGWRQGVTVGYIDFTREASVTPSETDHLGITARWTVSMRIQAPVTPAGRRSGFDCC